MLRRSIVKVLASFAAAIIGLLSLSSAAYAQETEKLPESASIVYDAGLLTNEEANNIKKQTMKNGEKVISVYVTEKSLSSDIESESMKIFEDWGISEDQMLLYYETSSGKYNWVVGADVPYFGVKEMQYSMSKAKEYLNSGDLGSGLAVAVSLSKIQMDQPGVFESNGGFKNSKSNKSDKSSSLEGFNPLGVIIPGSIVIAVIFIIVAVISSAKTRFSEALGKVSENTRDVIETNKEKSKEYVSSAEDNYNDRKAAVAKILEEEKSKAQATVAADYGFLESNNNDAFENNDEAYVEPSNENTFIDKNSKKDDLFGDWGKESSNDSIFGKRNDDPFKF